MWNEIEIIKPKETERVLVKLKTGSVLIATLEPDGWVQDNGVFLDDEDGYPLYWQKIPD